MHPLTRKRVAAAVAFNHLYTILREDDYVVSVYWLEIFYCFVRSLDGCDDLSIANALSHIERVIKVKANLLADSSPNRRKPHEFDHATLTYALYWLLSQCGTLDEHCRAKCMELYVNVSQYINVSPLAPVDTSQNINYAREMTQNFVRTYGINRLNDIILKGLESDITDICISNVMPLLKALDYYVWLIKEELLPIELLFSNGKVEEQTIFFCICSFTGQFWKVIAESLAGISRAVKSRELEQLHVLQCKVLMTTLNFIQVLLNVGVSYCFDFILISAYIRCKKLIY